MWLIWPHPTQPPLALQRLEHHIDVFQPVRIDVARLPSDHTCNQAQSGAIRRNQAQSGVARLSSDHTRAKPKRSQSGAIRRNQAQSVAIDHTRAKPKRPQSGAIRRNQALSGAIDHTRAKPKRPQSGAIRCNQVQSGAIDHTRAKPKRPTGWRCQLVLDCQQGDPCLLHDGNQTHLTRRRRIEPRFEH